MRGQFSFLLATGLLGTAIATIEAALDLDFDVPGSDVILDRLPEKRGPPSTDTCSNAVGSNEQYIQCFEAQLSGIC